MRYRAYGPNEQVLMTTNSRIFAWVWLQLRGLKLGAAIYDHAGWVDEGSGHWLKCGQPDWKRTPPKRSFTSKKV
jgi:hypothetical protein